MIQTADHNADIIPFIPKKTSKRPEGMEKLVSLLRHAGAQNPELLALEIVWALVV